MKLRQQSRIFSRGLEFAVELELRLLTEFIWRAIMEIMQRAAWGFYEELRGHFNYVEEGEEF